MYTLIVHAYTGQENKIESWTGPQVTYSTLFMVAADSRTGSIAYGSQAGYIPKSLMKRVLESRKAYVIEIPQIFG